MFHNPLCERRKKSRLGRKAIAKSMVQCEKMHTSRCCVIIRRQRCNYRLKARLKFDSLCEILTKWDSLRAVSQHFLLLHFAVAPCRVFEAARVSRFCFWLWVEARRNKHNDRMAKRSIRVLEAKLFFILLQNSIFLKNSELNIKKNTFCLTAIDGMKHTVHVFNFIFHIEGEGKKNYGEYRRLTAQKKPSVMGNNKKYSQ